MAQWASLTLQSCCKPLARLQVSTSISVRRHTDRAWHKHLTAEHPHLIIESVLAPYCAPRGSSAHKMATEKKPQMIFSRQIKQGEMFPDVKWSNMQCKSCVSAIWLLEYCTKVCYNTVICFLTIPSEPPLWFLLLQTESHLLLEIHTYFCNNRSLISDRGRQKQGRSFLVSQCQFVGWNYHFC